MSNGGGQWTDEELTVLLAIFISQPFAVGDDEHPVNRQVAVELGRSRGAVDRQWRNVRHHLLRLDLVKKAPNLNIGQNVKDVVDRYRVDFTQLRTDAIHAMEANGWNLQDLLGG